MAPASLTSLGQVNNPVLPLQTSQLPSKEKNISFLLLPPVLDQSPTPLHVHPSGTPVRYSISNRVSISSILSIAHLISPVVEPCI